MLSPCFVCFIYNSPVLYIRNNSDYFHNDVLLFGGEIAKHDGKFGVLNCRTVGSHSFSFDSQYYEYIFEPDYPDKPQTILTATVDGAENFMYSENTYSDAGEDTSCEDGWLRCKAELRKIA